MVNNGVFQQEACKLMDEENTFEIILLEAVDDGLAVLGESVKFAIYFHVKKKYAIEREKIPEKLEEFSFAIRQMFGPGAKVIENMILEKLCERLNLNYEDVKNKDIHVVVEELRIAKKQKLGFAHEFREDSDRDKWAGRSY